MATKKNTKAEALDRAKEIVEGWSTTALLTGWVPGSALFLTGADMVMVKQVADVFGVDVFDEQAFLTSVGSTIASALGGAAITEVVGLIPVVGWAIKSLSMAAKARLIGDAVVDYFYKLSPLPNGDDAPTPSTPT
jgi:uncharacterized protein (DUF697 family)